MSGKDLFEAMSYVEERFVDEAENCGFPKRIVSPWIKVASTAACLCLIIFSLYNLQPNLTGAAEGQPADGAPLFGNAEDAVDTESPPAVAEASRAPETMIHIIEVTATGFIGTVQNHGGFTAFDDGTEITVTVDPETDPDFKPEDYQIGDLVHVMYTDWDVNDRVMVASILGIVDEPIQDSKG